jgi:hippurate hydrolase
VPSVIFWLGAVQQAKWDAAQGDPTKLPSLHSSLWAPDKEPTLKTGAAALTVATLDLLGSPK